MTQEEFKDEALRLRPRLLEVARRYLDGDAAEDAVQDALLRLWQMLGQLHAPLDALATVLTRNLCVSTLRRRQPTQSLSEAISAPDGLAASTATPTDRIERMMNIVEQLPPMQQTILRLRHIEGMTMADIAAITGTNEVALRKALSRARQAVRLQYTKQYEQ